VQLACWTGILLRPQGRDNLSKIYGIWITITCFVAMGHHHSIANFFLVPIGMFYWTNFGMGKFIWASVLPITIGNIIGASFFGAFTLWLVYSMHEPSAKDRQDDSLASKV
jgi:formate/nitrite transporter FocA (FNT family)